ncbi:acid phosphatase/Vanadium-dependent haloperoxidase [Xylona heveae TC161]|uniref:Acid phosphatase/Vanadium-dependent haloperoxidase n=1 Tax=Xylona heveae (strain CBS 132557 / TC161) TaxID=1328760 RepID=A0A164Z9S9_XYLHT|nr:acid phosphatase/Vanadium-dependent haloperoxidase [Xylona heveae TC161]KZF18854.1 acid phosphatase/Vanadium-dependent haloperoxidase [Xylona heveae TC161]
MSAMLGSVSRAAGSPSKRLILSYIFDWFIILGIAAVAGGFSACSPNTRPFSLSDGSISFPHLKHETVSTSTLFLVCLVAPGIIIFLVCMLFVPGPAVTRQLAHSTNSSSRHSPYLRAVIWRRKLWEWNVGWMGLGLSLAVTFLLTEGMKNLFGKPRPDLIMRCNPVLVDAGRYVVSGVDGGALVTASICRPDKQSTLDDGFKSFPSGHSSASWAGLIYLTFFLCSKFAIAIPFLAPRLPPLPSNTTSTPRSDKPYANDPRSESPLPTESTNRASPADNASFEIRNSAAAPPTWVLVVIALPIGTAIFVSASRYYNYRHHGFDILFGSIMGFVVAWFAFRWYHLPITRGSGWAWGARSRDRAWGIGVGVQGYVGPEGWDSASSAGHSPERKTAVNGDGTGNGTRGSTGAGPSAVDPDLESGLHLDGAADDAARPSLPEH